MKPVLTFALVFGLPTLVSAHDFTIADLEIIHPKAFETPVAAKSGAGYLTIANNGETSDALIAVKADFPKVMLHKSEEQEGITRMMHVDRIDIPAGGMIELAPGGYHVMFMGLGGDPLEVGESIPAVLVFEKAGELEIDFEVEPRTDADAHAGHE